MEVTNEEIQWAWAIKQAARADPSIDHELISDLEYVQHAIMAKSATKTALSRLRKLQSFKARYGIVLDGSYEQGLRELKAFQQFFPDFYIGFGKVTEGGEENASTGGNFLCYDFSAYKVRRLVSEESYAMALRSFFYVLQACNPDIVSMRVGLLGILDVRRVGRDNLSLEQEKRVAQLLSHSYPLRIKGVVVMGANILIRLLFSFIKLLVSRKVARSYQFPATLKDFKERSNWSIPNTDLPFAWGGGQTSYDMRQVIKTRLKERYENAANFKLPALQESAPSLATKKTS